MEGRAGRRWRIGALVLLFVVGVVAIVAFWWGDLTRGDPAYLPPSESSVFALVDAAPYSSKRHVTIRYGADLSETVDGPLAVETTKLIAYDSNVVLGAEAILGQTAGEFFDVVFAERRGVVQSFALLMKMRDGSVGVWDWNFDGDVFSELVEGRQLGQSEVTPLLTAEQLTGASRGEFVEVDGRSFRADTNAFSGRELEAVYLFLVSSEETVISLQYAGFRASRTPSSVIEISGIGSLPAVNPPLLIVTTSDGERIDVTANDRSQYVFPRPEADLFSLVFRSGLDVFYPPYGRWFPRDHDFDGMVVRFEPEYVNNDGELSDLAAWQSSIKSSRLRSDFAQTSPHVRAWWTGTANKRVRFRSEYFLNNLGLHDRDMIGGVSDKCLYGLAFGESDIEARQVRLFEKSTTLAAENLSIALQRCVRIHSIAPGHSLQSYAHIEELIGRLDAKFVVFAANNSTFMYLTPAFQAAYFGYTPEHSPVDAFDLENGNLRYIPATDDSFNFPGAPTSVFPSGAAVAYAFTLPEADAPPEARNAWAVLGRLLERYHAEFPDTVIVLDTLYEVFRCPAQGDCGAVEQRSAREGVGNVPAGLPQFFENLSPYCEFEGVVCTALETDERFSGPFAQPLIYENDFHLTRAGNYWHARRFSDAIADRLR